MKFSKIVQSQENASPTIADRNQKLSDWLLSVRFLRFDVERKEKLMKMRSISFP